MNRPDDISSHAGGLVMEMVIESLDAGRRITIPIDSCSMAPWVVPGDRVDFAAPGHRLPSGAVVIALGIRASLTHRVVGRTAGRYLLKGDALPDFDGWFPADRIIGVAVAANRRGRTQDMLSGVNRARAIVASSLSRIQPIFWNGEPTSGFRGLAGRAFFFAYRAALAVLFFRS